MAYLAEKEDTAVIVKDEAERAGARERQRELAERLKDSGALDGIFAQIDSGQVPLTGDDGSLKTDPVGIRGAA